MKFKPNQFINSSKEITRVNGLKYTVRQNRHRFFFPNEWIAFYNSLTQRQRVTFKFLINTGARINEVRNIKVQDVDFDRNSIILKWTKGRNEDGSRKMRILSVSPQFIRWTRGAIKFFKLNPEDNFPILSTPAANICMKKALEEVGIEDWKMFSLYNIRKTLETWLISLDVDSSKISKHFGHSVKTASQFYVNPETFSFDDKKMIRSIIGDLYSPQQNRF